MTNFAYNFANGQGFPIPAAPGITVIPGAARGASINAAITAAAATALATGVKQTVYLQAGTYTLETAILMASNVVLRGVGDATILVPTFTGGADTATNYVIGADGAIVTATINTTLTTKITKNKSTTVVTAVGTITASDWFLVQGRNTPSEDGSTESNGTSVILSELMLPATTYAGGTTIATRWPWMQAHGTTAITVRGVTPVIGCEIRDLQIQGSSGVTTANGIFARYCSDLTISGVSYSGCSRMGIDVIGCRVVHVYDCRSRGTNNGWLMMTSVCSARFERLTGDQGVARLHGSGTPRYPIFLRSRCTDVTFDDIHLTGTICGMYACGEHIHGGIVKVTDVSILKAEYDRMVTGTEIDSGANIIMGFGTGLGPLVFAELSYDIRVDQIHTENLRAEAVAGFNSPTPIVPIAVYPHDVLYGSYGAIHCVNRGETSDVATVGGVIVSDFAGCISSLIVAGHVYGLVLQNSANDVSFGYYDFRGGAGNTPNSTIPLLLMHTTPSAQTIHFREVRIVNAGSTMRTAGSFVGDIFFRIDLLNSEGNEWSDVIVAKNESATAFAVGDVVEIDTTHTDNNFVRIITPVAGVRRLFAVATADITSAAFMLGCTLPARIATVTATAAAVAKGDPVEYAATRSCATNAVSLNPFGTSLTSKGAGAGLIRVCLPSIYGGAA